MYIDDDLHTCCDLALGVYVCVLCALEDVCGWQLRMCVCMCVLLVCCCRFDRHVGKGCVS